MSRKSLFSCVKTFTDVNKLCLRSLHYAAICCQTAGATQPSTPEVVIPFKKKRDSVAILKALASTVQRDERSPHYKYMDDPFLIPTTTIDKRSYALAKASGHHAAQYAIKRTPHLFKHDLAEPHIPALSGLLDLMLAEDTVEGLQERIALRKVTDAANSYQRCKESGLNIPAEVLHDLFDLICISNSKDLKDPLLPDELWFFREEDSKNEMRKTWDDYGLAETIFKDFPENDAHAYQSLIKGRAKFLQVDKAIELFKEAQSKNMPMDVETYNHVLGVTTFAFNETEDRWKCTKSILAHMKENNVQPTVETFRVILHMLHHKRSYDRVSIWVLQLINEMKAIDIRPSLACWYYVLLVFYAERAESHVLYQIIETMKDEEFTYQHPDDCLFFNKAMNICNNILKDMELAYNIDAVVRHGNNIQFLTGLTETYYYTNFLEILYVFEQFDTVMEYYDRISPHCYIPTFRSTTDLLKAIEMNEAYSYLPRLWSDLVKYKYNRRIDLVSILLQSMSNVDEQRFPELMEPFHEVVKKVISMYKTDQLSTRLTSPMKLNASVISSMCTILLKDNSFQEAWEVMELYLSKRDSMDGLISEDCLVLLIHLCIAHGQTERAVNCLHLMADAVYTQLDTMTNLVCEKLSLTDTQRQEIEDLM